MSEWMSFINSLGHAEMSVEFFKLNKLIGESPLLSEDQVKYNDPMGHTKYYKYIQSGLEVGFRKGVLNHIHFYFDGCDGYGAFKGKLLSGICSGWNEESVTQALGAPDSEDGGKVDMFLGYMNRWVKYKKETYALHLQFDQNNLLCRVSLMIN